MWPYSEYGYIKLKYEIVCAKNFELSRFTIELGHLANEAKAVHASYRLLLFGTLLAVCKEYKTAYAVA